MAETDPIPTSVNEIERLILSFHPVIVIETVEEERVEQLLAEVSRETALPLFSWSLSRGLVASGQDTAILGTKEPGGALAHVERLTIEAIFHLKDLGAHLGEPGVLRQFRDVAARFAHTRSTLVLSGASVALPAEIGEIAVPYELALPTEAELGEVVDSVVASLSEKGSIEIALDADGRRALLRGLRGLTLNQARQAVAHCAIEDRRLDASDVPKILERKAQAIHDGGLLDYFPPADNRYEMGGFERLKQWLVRARVGFSEEARALNLAPPKGILLVGVQGCGKSLAAKAIAREWQLPLVKLEAARLYDKYVGESEKNLRRAVETAEALAPVVLWIDEVEKALAPSAGPAEGDGGLSRRLFGFFLTWLQEKREDVFVVATANDVFGLPPELLRKGRFDEIFFVDLPAPDERRAIFDIHLRLRKQDPARLDLAVLVEQTEGYSGAEIEQAVVASLYRALHEKKPLTTTLLLREISETRPLSVSRREDVARLRALGRERFTPVR
jgi:MoxR-like ATPase